MRNAAITLAPVIVLVVCLAIFGIGAIRIVQHSGEARAANPDSAKNAYGGYTYRDCEAPIAGGTCHALVFDGAGDQVCAVQIPLRDVEPPIKLGAVTCRDAPESRDSGTAGGPWPREIESTKKVRRIS